MALNAALPGGSLNTKTFNAKSISAPIKGILLTIGVIKFFVSLNKFLLPVLPKVRTSAFLERLVNGDRRNFPITSPVTPTLERLTPVTRVLLVFDGKRRLPLKRSKKGRRVPTPLVILGLPPLKFLAIIKPGKPLKIIIEAIKVPLMSLLNLLEKSLICS